MKGFDREVQVRTAIMAGIAAVGIVSKAGGSEPEQIAAFVVGAVIAIVYDVLAFTGKTNDLADSTDGQHKDKRR